MISDPARRLAERPTYQARHYLASSGHYLATAAAVRVLDAGGNATDAGVAAGLCINVLMPELTSFGGVAPIMAYDKSRELTKVITGLGYWSKSLTLDAYLERFDNTIPIGAGRSVVPAAAHSWLTALELFGTMSFAQVVAPALELCAAGFPMYASTHRNLIMFQDNLELWPHTASIYLPDGGPPAVGSVLKQLELAGTFRKLIDAEDRMVGSREQKLVAARDEFYQGEIGRTIARFVADGGGFMTPQDLAEFSVDVEDPLVTNYRGIDVLACGPWCQGPAVLQTLDILEGFDLTSFVHNSPDYLHVMDQALTLAFADREQYYGDPKHVTVPLDQLLSKEYAKAQQERISMERAFAHMPAGGLGDVEWRGTPEAQPVDAGFPEPDTSYVCVVDRWGNAFSSTPSDGIGTSPIVPGVGLTCSGRGVQSSVDPNHPASIGPGKRPRLTPNPAMAFRDGKLLMPFGTPGGDMQPQAMVQSFVNMVDFGMDVQEAIEKPRIATYNYPSSGWPHKYRPGLSRLEGRLAGAREDLEARGHVIEMWPQFSRLAGNFCAIVVDHENGTLNGGADSRAEAYVGGW